MMAEEILGSFDQALQDRAKTVTQNRAPGQRVIGWMCTYVPEEVIHAAGMYPVRVWGGPEPTSTADSYLHVDMCSLVRSTFEQALRGNYNYLNGFVTLNACDNIRRLYDNWAEYVPTPFHHLMSVPHKVTQPSIDYFATEVARLKEHLEQFFKVAITPQALSRSIELYNQSRCLLEELTQTRRQEKPPLSGAEFLNVVLAGMILPREKYTRTLQELLAALKREKRQTKLEGARILLVGSELDDADLVNVIEQAGGVVVADDLCTGARYFTDLVKDGANPINALAHRYLSRLDCPRMRPSDKRVEHIFKLIPEYKIEGVILSPILFCKLHLEAGMGLTQKLQEKKVPVLSITREYTLSGLGQIKTRVETFAEMIQGA